jgi:hypothetical protein
MNKDSSGFGWISLASAGYCGSQTAHCLQLPLWLHKEALTFNNPQQLRTLQYA